MERENVFYDYYGVKPPERAANGEAAREGVKPH